MPKKQFDISELSKYMGEIEYSDPEVLAREKEDISIPDTFFEDTAADDNSIEGVFVTKFSPSDVDDFRQILQANPPQKYQKDAKANLGKLLTKAIKEWLKAHTNTECFVEPFLWALKETDNYIGSITHGNMMPPPWIVSEVGNSLLEFWKINNPEFSAVLRNVLLNWDWYQPLHLMMYVYSRLKNYQDEALDRKLRKDWLYRIYYANAVIECLCAKPHTRDNIKALLQFVCADYQKDILQPTTQIDITHKMRENVRDYLASAEKIFDAYAAECYTAFRPNASKKATQMFDWLFNPGTDPDPSVQVKEFVNRWANVPKDNTDELQLLEMQLIYNLNDKETNTLLIQAAGNLPILTERIAKYYSDQRLSFETQFPLLTIAQSSKNIPVYKEFIEKRYQKDGAHLTNETGVQIGCSYCLAGHPELTEPLARAVFLDGLGVNCRIIFFKIIPCYSKQFKLAAESIRDDCLKDIQLACRLLTNCAVLYRKDQAVHTNYPIIFDEVCAFVLNMMLEQLENDSNIHNAVRYGKVLINHLEKVADVSNRGNYKEMLEKIINIQTKKPAFTHSVKEPARKLYKKLYPL